MSERFVVVLDLDGVISRSNFVKHRAMLALFADCPDRYAAVDAYIFANRQDRRRADLASRAFLNLIAKRFQ